MTGGELLDGGRAHSLAFLFIRGVMCLWPHGLGSVYTWRSGVKGKVDGGSGEGSSGWLALKVLQQSECRQTFLRGSRFRLHKIGLEPRSGI